MLSSHKLSARTIGHNFWKGAGVCDIVVVDENFRCGIVSGGSTGCRVNNRNKGDRWLQERGLIGQVACKINIERIVEEGLEAY